MAHAQKPDFVFRRNGRVHLNRRGRQSSRLLAAEVCASAFIVGSNAGYTMFRGSVKGTGYPLRSPVSPSLPLPCHRVPSNFNRSLLICTLKQKRFYVLRPTTVTMENAVVAHCNVFYYHNIHMKVLTKTSKITLVMITKILGHAVAQMVKALRYNPEGRGFDFRWCHWDFSLTQSFRPHYGPWVDTVPNGNEDQGYPLWVKAAGA